MYDSRITKFAGLLFGFFLRVFGVFLLFLPSALIGQVSSRSFTAGYANLLSPIGGTVKNRTPYPLAVSVVESEAGSSSAWDSSFGGFITYGAALDSAPSAVVTIVQPGERYYFEWPVIDSSNVDLACNVHVVVPASGVYGPYVVESYSEGSYYQWQIVSDPDNGQQLAGVGDVSSDTENFLVTGIDTAQLLVLNEKQQLSVTTNGDVSATSPSVGFSYATNHFGAVVTNVLTPSVGSNYSGSWVDVAAVSNMLSIQSSIGNDVTNLPNPFSYSDLGDTSAWGMNLGLWGLNDVALFPLLYGADIDAPGVSLSAARPFGTLADDWQSIFSNLLAWAFCAFFVRQLFDDCMEQTHLVIFVPPQTSTVATVAGTTIPGASYAARISTMCVLVAMVGMLPGIALTCISTVSSQSIGVLGQLVSGPMHSLAGSGVFAAVWASVGQVVPLTLIFVSSVNYMISAWLIRVTGLLFAITGRAIV